MTERTHPPQAAERKEHMTKAEELLQIDELRNSAASILEKFPSLQGMATEDAHEVFHRKVQAVYQAVRDHLDRVEKKLPEDIALLSESEFQQKVTELFSDISQITSNPGEQIDSVRVSVDELPELDILQAMYRNILERRSSQE